MKEYKQCGALAKSVKDDGNSKVYAVVKREINDLIRILTNMLILDTMII